MPVFFFHAPMHGEMPIYSGVTPGVGIRAGLGHATSCCILQPLSAPAGQHTAEPSIKSRRQRRSKAGLSLKDKVLEKASTPPAAAESTPEPTYAVPARDFKWRQHLPCVTPLSCTRMHPKSLASGMSEDVLGEARPPQCSHCGGNTMQSPQSSWGEQQL